VCPKTEVGGVCKFFIPEIVVVKSNHEVTTRVYWSSNLIAFVGDPNTQKTKNLMDEIKWMNGSQMLR